jgi:hypothetical protein
VYKCHSEGGLIKGAVNGGSGNAEPLGWVFGAVNFGVGSCQLRRCGLGSGGPRSGGVRSGEGVCIGTGSGRAGPEGVSSCGPRCRVTSVHLSVQYARTLIQGGHIGTTSSLPSSVQPLATERYMSSAGRLCESYTWSPGSGSAGLGKWCVGGLRGGELY